MNEKNIFENLSTHFASLGMPIPTSEEFVEILRANLTTLEAEVLMALPNKIGPLDFVELDNIPLIADLSKEEMKEILDRVSEKGIVFTGSTKSGKKGYALWQRGFGFSQAFHWKGEDTPHAQKMAHLIEKYKKNPKVLKETKIHYKGTKPYRYIPVGQSIKTDRQAVYSKHMMEGVIKNANAFAVCHCPCRVRNKMIGKNCDHPTEVCLKFNDAARFLIEKGFAREITYEEALEIILKSEEAGLVHFVDNAGDNIQHNCNCCGCVCWNVGPIRRRAIPRDAIMATYFFRETDGDECVGCGQCIEICPVDAVKMEEDIPVVDLTWCIGCGVCAKRCPNEAIRMVLRPDRTGDLPANTFRELHKMILKERGIG
jgi:Fe-S-cluster-containing hydrogenase component 2